MLTRRQTKAFYDWLGARQDWQTFFEDPAIDDLIAHAKFDMAQLVCEFGSGTGRLAERLLAKSLPSQATYVALDLSTTMTRLAAARLRPWAGRAYVIQTDGSTDIPICDRSVDRIVTSYVLDLLSDAEIREFLDNAYRALQAGGLLCNVSLTFGQAPWSRTICALWRKIHDWRPVLVGGCRPVQISEYLRPDRWRIKHLSVVCRYGVCSEVVIAGRLTNPGSGPV